MTDRFKRGAGHFGLDPLLGAVHPAIPATSRVSKAQGRSTVADIAALRVPQPGYFQ